MQKKKDTRLHLKFENDAVNEELFSQLVSNTKDYAIFILDTAGYIMTWNLGAEYITGYSPEEIIGKNISVFYINEEKERGEPENNLKRAQQEGRLESESWRVRKDGTKIWVNVIFTPLYDSQNQLKGFAKITKDISQRKEFENQLKRLNQELEDLLKEKNHQLTGIFDRVTDAFVSFDKNLNYIYINKNASEILSRNPEDIVGKNIWTEFPEKKQYPYYKNLQKALEEQISIRVEDYYPPSDLWFQALIFPSADGVCVYLHDITDTKKAELAVVESERKYRTIIETAQEGVWVVDEDNRTSFVNNKMCEILGYTREEMIGRELYFFMDDEARHIAAEKMQKKKEGYSGQEHFKYISKEGKVVWTNISANPLYDEDGTYKGALAMITDITENVRLEQQLINEQIEKQKEITRAAVNAQEKERTEIGIELHDNVNQLLAASKLYLDYSLNSMGDFKASVIKSKEYLTTAMEEIRKLTKALVGPAKEETKGLIDSIKELVSDINLINDVKIKITHSGYSEAKSDVGLKIIIYRIIQEQLNNILKHAEATRVKIALFDESDFVNLIIKDNGKGFDTSVKKQGIGLKNIQHRAQVYDGTVDIISSHGNGCIMKITFKNPG